MSMFLIALSLPLVAAAGDPPKPAPKKIGVARMICQPKRMTPAQDDIFAGKPVPRVRKLNEMPSGKERLAVLRMINGCDVSTVVGENIGG